MREYAPVTKVYRKETAAVEINCRQQRGFLEIDGWQKAAGGEAVVVLRRGSERGSQEGLYSTQCYYVSVKFKCKCKQNEAQKEV